MNSYNGFSSAQRYKAQRWLNARWADGAFPRPSRCCACGQMDGIIHAHAEDYSEPFAHGKTDEYPLCFCCHMMVHCRFLNPAAWKRYREMIGEGWVHAPVRSFPQFQGQLLSGPAAFNMAGRWHKRSHKPARRPLDGIEGRGSTGPSDRPRSLAGV